MDLVLSMFFISVIIDSFNHPVSTTLFLLSLYIGTQLLIGTYLKLDHFALTYNDIIKKTQVYKVIATSFSHTSWIHLLFDLISLWCIRQLESIYGSFYFLKYTIVLMICESIISLLLLYLLTIIARLTTNPFENTKFTGSSGFVLAWLTYASIESTTNTLYNNTYYYILGLIPIYWLFAPLIMALLIPIIANRHNAVANISGLLTGYLMYTGIIQILPNTYWTICNSINILLFILVNYANPPTNISPPRNLLSTQHEVYEIFDFGHDSLGTSRSMTDRNPENRRLISLEGEEEEDDEEMKTRENDDYNINNNNTTTHEGQSLLSPSSTTHTHIQSNAITSSFGRVYNSVFGGTGARRRSSGNSGDSNITHNSTTNNTSTGFLSIPLTNIYGIHSNSSSGKPKSGGGYQDIPSQDGDLEDGR